jgi:hypothetical protein
MDDVQNCDSYTNNFSFYLLVSLPLFSPFPYVFLASFFLYFFFLTTSIFLSLFIFFLSFLFLSCFYLRQNNTDWATGSRAHPAAFLIGTLGAASPGK